MASSGKVRARPLRDGEAEGREKELGKSSGQEEGAPQRHMEFLGLEVGIKHN